MPKPTVPAAPESILHACGHREVRRMYPGDRYEAARRASLQKRRCTPCTQEAVRLLHAAQEEAARQKWDAIRKVPIGTLVLLRRELTGWVGTIGVGDAQLEVLAANPQVLVRRLGTALMKHLATPGA